MSVSWWDEGGFWYGLHTLLDPVRVPFFRTVLESHRSRVSRPLVLDIGSGGGFVAAGVSDIAEVVAIDLSLDSLRDAKTSGLRMLVVAEAADLPFRDDSYESVICSEVLEHVADPTGVVAEAARVVKPQGLFLFSTPSRTYWSRLLLINVAQKWRLTRVLPNDLHDWNDFLTAHELTALLAKVGFSTRKICGIGIKAMKLPKAGLALVMLKTGLVGYGEAGRKIDLTVTKKSTVAMIGYAVLGGS